MKNILKLASQIGCTTTIALDASLNAKFIEDLKNKYQFRL